MASSSSPPSEDVNDFLLRIRELGNKRDKEDEERTRKLEEEIIQGRKERQARRAERARSISPEKGLIGAGRGRGHRSTPSAVSISASASASASASRITPPVDLLPTHHNNSQQSESQSREGEDSQSREGEAEAEASTDSMEQPTPAGPAAAASFASWRQARHKSHGSRSGEEKEKEKESDAGDDHKDQDKDDNHDEKDTTPSSPISQARGRTPAAAATSFAAFRAARENNNNKAMDMHDVPSLTPTPISKRIDPSSSSAAEPLPQQLPDDRPPSPSRSPSRFSISNPAPSLGSPSPLTTRPRMNSRASLSHFQHNNDNDAIACSPAQSRLNPLRPGSPERQSPMQGQAQAQMQDRPSSPTKGLGGFVQSAMMRRSDSVSKRWSAMNLGGVAAAGIARRESVSSNHHNDEPFTPAIMSPALDNNNNSTPMPTRAGTLHGTSASSARPKSLHLKQRSDSISSTPASSSSTTTPILAADNTPTSPSKRWSPTKASWLESALNRPESPTKRNPPPAFGQEPEWKSQLARMKASRQAAAAQAQAQAQAQGRDVEKKENVPAMPVLRKAGELGGRSFAGRMQVQKKGDEEEKKGDGEEEKRKASEPPARPEKSAVLRRSLEKKKDLGGGGGDAATSPATATTTSPSEPEPASDTLEKPQEKEEPTEKKKPIPPKPTISTSNTSSSASVLSRINSLNSTKSNPRTPSPNKLRESPSQFDFRSNLRRRDPPAPAGAGAGAGAGGGTADLERRPSNAALARPAAAAGATDGPANEFQNVFAKLKRANTNSATTTSSTSASAAVAGASPSAAKPPSSFKDDFKENITRGKSALTATGGPKKTERVDEFKQSLNKQRESFKVKDETGHPVGLRGRTGSILEKRAEGVPEALERRRALKSSVDLRSVAREKEREPPVPTPTQMPFGRSLSQKKNVVAPAPAVSEKKTEEDTDKNKASPITDHQQQQQPTTTTSSSSRPLAPGIANRLNPSLANLLSRGPPSPNNNEGSSRASPVSASGTSSPAVSTSRPPLGGSRSASSDAPAPVAGPGPALTHMTKGRAKGPKRRAPKVAAAAALAAKPAGGSAEVGRKLPALPVSAEAASSEEPLQEPLQARISRLRSGIAAKREQEGKGPAVDAVPVPASASASPPPVAKKSDDVRRISENLSRSGSVEVVRKDEGDGEKTPPPPPVPLHKKPSLEKKEEDKPALPKRSSWEVMKDPASSPKPKPPSPALPKKPSFENRPSPTLAKKPSLEARKPSPGLSPKPDLPARPQGPLSPSISDRLNQFQGTAAPFKGLRKSPTWGGKPGNEARPAVPAKDGDDEMDKPRKSPPPLRSPSSTIQLGESKGFPALTKARTWGAAKAIAPAPGSGSPSEKFRTPELPLRKPRHDDGDDGNDKENNDAAPAPVEKDTETDLRKERRPTLPRKSSSAGTLNSPVQNPTHEPNSTSTSTVHAPAPSYSSSASSRASSSFASIASTTTNTSSSAPHRNTLIRKLPIIPSATQMTQRTKSPVPEANASSDTASITSTSTSTVDVDPKKPARRRPTPLKLKSLPSIPVQPIVQAAAKPLPSPQTSPFPERQVANTLFTSFFDAPPKASDKIAVDPVPFFERAGEAEEERVKTLSTQLWELQGHGKKRSLPVNQEHILFEESMYLLVHTFEDSSGAKAVQTVLWVGDEVNESAFEDAQLFARKVAKEHNTKLELMNQGKEDAPFIQALGGIIVIRRGASGRANPSSSYMLCGRRHLGQIVFDEVDLSAKSLCSGYPYIISTSSDKVYLWEGQGSGADELGCARLIAMDLVLNGEINQVMEGEESSEFWSLFADSREVQAAEKPAYWKSKRTNEKYTTRLFRVDHDRGRRSGFWGRRDEQSPVKRPNAVVREIKNYVQRDLDPAHIHIVDAFFEIYVVVGERASGRHAEFATALVFAQEYGIMAVSMEDRPFLPHTSVVLYGFPDDAKKVFRKWSDRRALTGRKVPDIINLRAAIEAIR